MKIAFNATPLLSPLTGIGQYTYHLARELLAMQDSISLDFFYASGWSGELRDKPIQGINHLKSWLKYVIPNAYWVSRRLQQHQFDKGVKLNNPSLYHEPNFLAFRFSGPSIITVHDLSWIRFPETHPIERVRAMNRYFEPGLRRAQLILTDSEFVKRELIEVFGVSDSKIKSVSLGVDAMFHPRTSEQTESLLTQHQLTHGQYLLSVGTLEPRKNVQASLEAYQQLPQSLRQSCPLVITGMKGWHTEALQKQLEPLIRSGEIRQIGYLPRHELATLISGALAMVYPSLYEGFGLPPLEAMASGVPVISSNVSSLPEVVGDTGLLVDPHDRQALNDAMKQMISAPDVRNQMAKKSLKRSALFSWNTCALNTVDAYKQVALL